MKIKNVLDGEIKWCYANRGKSKKPKVFEDGFIAGLKQAKFITTKQIRLLRHSRKSK